MSPVPDDTLTPPRSSFGLRRATAASYELLQVCLFLTTLSLAALFWCWFRGYTLYYGDAEAHLNIARRILDSRTPGSQEIGTVWLPVPHLLMMPLARLDALWRTGLAGSIPSGVCFVVAAMLLYAAVRRLLGGAAAVTTLAVFALNPNLLYLQAIPMTEPIFFAALGGIFYCAVRFQEDPSSRFAAGAGAAALIASLTRYEGWFVIPFVALFVLLTAHRNRVALCLFALFIASLGPMLWLAHNWRWWGDSLEFVRATRAAVAMNQAAQSGGASHYAGDHHWLWASAYYGSAVELCVGLPLLFVGAAGIVASFRTRAVLPLLLLLPIPLFYVWTIHSSGIRVYVTQLAPYSLYNTRYGLAALPLVAVACGAVVARTRRTWRVPLFVAITTLAISPSLRKPWPESSVCWTEARDTSVGRRTTVDQVAASLRDHYHSGEGILMSFGDSTGALREAGISLREALTQDNGREWQEATKATTHPDPRSSPLWALSAPGDQVAALIEAASNAGVSYSCRETPPPSGGPPLRLCRRDAEGGDAQWVEGVPFREKRGPGNPAADQLRRPVSRLLSGTLPSATAAPPAPLPHARTAVRPKT